MPILPQERGMDMIDQGAGPTRRDFLLTLAAAGAAIGSAGTAKETQEQHMDIQRIGTKPSGKGPADWFTGTVRIDPLFDRTDPARVNGASVTFEPGARTAWHT